MRIGIVDHHLNNYHADKFLSLLRGPLKDEGLEIAAAWESDPTGDDWCAKNGVRRASDPADAVREADAVMLLAPDNIEDHRKLAETVLPFGKPTLIDKFLALNLTDSKAILALAEKHKAPIFSSSSLRYAVELKAVKEDFAGGKATEVYVRGMGAWDGYGVHSVSMALRIMGSDAKRLIDTGTTSARTVTLDYGEDRRALIDVRTASNEWDEFNWRFAFRTGDRYVSADIKEYDGFYANLMKEAAAFFRTGKSSMSVAEALTTVAILEGANRSRAAGGQWMDIVS